MNTLRVIACTAVVTAPSIALGVIVPFTEEFATDGANWRDNANAPVTWSANGGPEDSSYASAGFNFVASAADATPSLSVSI